MRVFLVCQPASRAPAYSYKFTVSSFVTWIWKQSIKYNERKHACLHIMERWKSACLPCSRLTSRIIFVGVSHSLHHHSRHGAMTEIVIIEAV